MADQATERRKTLVGSWCDPDLVERLDAAALLADRSRAGEVRVAIRRHLSLPLDDHNEEVEHE
jgi:hypothetical protein